MIEPYEFAQLSSANAACIARELIALNPDALRDVSSFDPVSEAAVVIAGYEGPEIWEAVGWEDVCADIAKVIAESGKSPSRAWIKQRMGVH